MSQVRKIRRRQQPPRPKWKPKYEIPLKKVDFAELEIQLMSRMPEIEDRLRDPHTVLIDSLLPDTRAAYDLLAQHRAVGLERRVLTVVSEHDEAMRRLERQIEDALNRIHTLPEIR